MESTKAYVLQLRGLPIYTGAAIIIEVGGVSLDRARLESLKAQKDAELSTYFDGTCTDPMCLGWRDPACAHDCEGKHDLEREWCYLNTDYVSCPTWVVCTHDLV